VNVRRGHIVGLAALFSVAAGLYWAKIEGQVARERLTALEQQIQQDRRAVRTLEAEIAFLERPDRLETAATETLGLVPIESARRVALGDVPSALAKAELAPKTSASLAPLVAPSAVVVLEGATRSPVGAGLPEGAGQ
jgi:cell division protein FtsL